MAPKFALFTKGSKLPLNKGFKNMFELLSLALNPRHVLAAGRGRGHVSISSVFWFHSLLPLNVLYYSLASSLSALLSLFTLPWWHRIITKTCLFKYTEMKIIYIYNENIQIKNSDILHIIAQTIDCGYSLEPSNEYPQSMFLRRNKINNVYPVNPSFRI